MMIPPALIRLTFALGLALAATACASPGEKAAAELTTPTEQFPLKATTAPDDTLLAVHPGGVSPTQAAALADLTRRWREAGGDPIVLRAPGGLPSDPQAMAMAQQARAILIAAGVPDNLVRVERYDSAGDAAAPLVASFVHYQADVPKCGQKWDSFTATQSNTAFANFGCAVSANMAAQVANPRDLMQARQEDPIESSRSTFQSEQYRKGEATNSKAIAEIGKSESK